MKPEFSVAICQLNSIDDLDTNLMQIESLLDKIPERSPVDLVCFPENSILMRLKEGEKIQGVEIHHEVFQTLRQRAVKQRLNIHLGALPLRMDGHLYNSSVFITAGGEIKATYQKMHLFDIQLEGQSSYRESDVFRHGQSPHILEIDGWKIGQSICYDIRFSELYSYYAKRECDIILVPSAFLVKTGEAHWDVLLRARAIESQAYIVASAQGGTHQGIRGGVRETYGNSLIVDPWGKVVCRLDRSPEMQIYVLSNDVVKKVRQQIPMRDHRRL